MSSDQFDLEERTARLGENIIRIKRVKSKPIRHSVISHSLDQLE